MMRVSVECSQERNDKTGDNMNDETTKPKYGVQTAPISGVIHVGRLNTTRTAFLDKEDATDMVLAAVAQYVKRHFDGGMVADFPGLGLELTVSVKPFAVLHDDADEGPDCG